MSSVPVLMYHALEDADHPAGAKDPGEQRYVLQADEFREQMSYLRRVGFRAFLIEELQALAVWPDKAVVLTFDDGHESNFTLALPILQEYGFKAEFFITTGWTGTPYFMNGEQIRGLHNAGMRIGSHGVTHRFLPDVSETDMKSELNESKKFLEDSTGIPVKSMSYPGGRMNKQTHRLAHLAGYDRVFTSAPQYLQQTSDQMLIDRFPVTAGVTLRVFASLLHGRSVNGLAFRYTLLSTAKSVLGNSLYNRIRTMFIFGKKAGRLEHE